MKKRIAKKIYRRVSLDLNIALFNALRFGFNPFIAERTVVLDKPLRIYSRSQFIKACKVLNEAVPKCTFDSTAVPICTYQVSLKDTDKELYTNIDEAEKIVIKVNYAEENHHDHITCVPGNTQPPR